MQQLEEEEAARAAEEKRLAEERIAKQKKEEERIVAEERKEEERRALARDAAFHRMVEENRKEKEKARAERQLRGGLRAPLEKIYKSMSIVPDSSEEANEPESTQVPTPGGVKRTRMIARIGGPPSDDSKHGSGDEEDEDDDEEEPDQVPSKTPCSRCVSQGKPRECKPHWSGNNTSWRSRSKRMKVDHAESGECLGDTRRIAEKKFGGVEFGGKLDGLERRLGALERFASRLTMAILVRREEREMGREENINKDEEEEDKDGEGEEEKSEEEKREEVREGKKRAE
ncbi:hypothetical protein F5050DRAFT_1813217 [Lentinula boryana]|uniref:Uncharacterized protein n=1 Tax=Lentinula boryana TaxID=40481 RepID=A0ABQ8PWY6_9AGAR|nr:hypothetical protein F5050DRAFT_1813217 [Lentinula boryana]